MFSTKRVVSECKQRQGVITEELEKARKRNDQGSVERLLTEEKAIGSYLSSALGIGGHRRRFKDARERARQSAAAAINRCLASIRSDDPSLADFLEARITTGKSLLYLSDHTSWDF
jgi:hypothetical protein